MKTVTQKDFQNLYKSPGLQETEEMNQTLEHLPEKLNTERSSVFRGHCLALALTIVLVLGCIVALGVGLYNGKNVIVSWDGEVAEDIPRKNEPSEEESEHIRNLAASYPENEAIMITRKVGKNNTQTYRFGKSNRYVYTEAELMGILDACGYPHPDNLIPNGWSIYLAYIHYALTPDGKNELIEEKEIEDGAYTVQRYKIDNEHQVVDGYFISLVNDAGENIAISSEASPGPCEFGFGLTYPDTGDIQFETPSIPGMESARFVRYGDHTRLHTYRPLEKPFAVNADHFGGSEVYTYDYEVFLCYNLEVEDFIAIFGGPQ